MVNIQELFTRTKIVETEEIKTIYKSNVTFRINTATTNSLSPSSLTPMSKAIYDNVDTAEKKRLLIDFAKDNSIINFLEDQDPDYIEKMENNQLGFYMEDFVCHNFKCPYCGEKSLHKFAIHNMPVVDLLCSNREYHIANGEPFLFQVKISLDNNTYFRKKNYGFIYTGSIRYGNEIVKIKANDVMKNKMMLVSYICLRLNREREDKYRINISNSFILVPKINNVNNDHYYYYGTNKNRFGQNMMLWNDRNVDVLDINNYISNYQINTGTIYVITRTIANPYKHIHISKKIDF